MRTDIVGHVASAADFRLFDLIPHEPETSRVHAVRWYRHIQRLSERLRSTAPDTAQVPQLESPEFGVPSHSPRPFRILCCHGFAQSAAVFVNKRAKELATQPGTRALLELLALDGLRQVEEPHQRAFLKQPVIHNPIFQYFSRGGIRRCPPDDVAPIRIF